MDIQHTITIERWIEDVCASQQKKQSPADRLPTPSTSPERGRKRQRESDPTAMPDPHKRLRTTDSDTGSVLSPLRDNITLTPSVTSDSVLSRPRQRSSSPTRIKADLAAATPRISYLHESTDPESDAAKRLLAFLTHDHNNWEPQPDEITKIATASCKCAVELRSEGSWIIDVARPLLQLAIGEFPLECWSVQTESVDPKYQPRYTVRDTYNRKIDLVVGLPRDQWEPEYEKVGINVPGRYQSHVAHPHTGKRLLGPGFEVKASDGNLIEAQVQLGVWMTGLALWAFDHRTGTALPPPMVGCTVIGERWEFYIIYGIEGPSSELSQVCVWGPLSDLDGRTGKDRATSALAKTLRRVMEYTRTTYADQLLAAMI